MKTKLPEFARGATNVYRTEEYIVKQCVELLCGYPEPTEVMSRDTYYRRTKRRDAEYEMLFCGRKRLYGKSLRKVPKISKIGKGKLGNAVGRLPGKRRGKAV